jgi:pimeloyl-ACP methyl ester carboxylesterase
MRAQVLVSRRAFSAFTKSGARDDLVADWAGAALSDRARMRDLAKVTAGLDKRFTLAAVAALRGSHFPLLLVWAPGDKYFLLAEAERLATDVGGAKLLLVPDAATFVPLDQPQALATHIADFAPSP